ncbi:MAG: alpha/beta hydrolase, partial [Betaproteobacteria bacterium]|nr:alpha/beta hydrolase [Betaproteobacteria bacterium]
MMPNPLTRNNVTVTGNRGARKTIVFVNGLGTDQSYWNRVTPAFANDYRLVLFDNVGAIEANQEYFRENQFRYLNVNGYATDLLEICSTLDLNGDTVLVGHSLGAM